MIVLTYPGEHGSCIVRRYVWCSSCGFGSFHNAQSQILVLDLVGSYFKFDYFLKIL